MWHAQRHSIYIRTVKFTFSKKAKKIDKIFTVDLRFTKYACTIYCRFDPMYIVKTVKLAVKISSIFVAFLENKNFESGNPYYV